jgi:hypothetical protein
MNEMAVERRKAEKKIFFGGIFGANQKKNVVLEKAFHANGI